MSRMRRLIIPIVGLFALAAMLAGCNIANFGIDLSNNDINATNVTYDFHGDYQADGGRTVGCAEIQFETETDSYTKPAGLDITNAVPVDSTGPEPWDWTTWTVQRDIPNGRITLTTDPALPEPPSSTLHLAIGNITNPSIAGTYIATVRFTDDNTCWSGNEYEDSFTIEDPSIAIANSQVNVEVEPQLALTVAAKNDACNAEARSSGASSTATAVSLGRLAASQTASASQALTLSTNAAQGGVVYLKRTTDLAAGSEVIDNVAGSNLSPVPFPAVGAEAFGYTTDSVSLSATGDGAARFSGDKWAALSASDAEVLRMTGATTTSGCVGYKIGTSANTSAGAYSTTVIYTAVAQF